VERLRGGEVVEVVVEKEEVRRRLDLIVIRLVKWDVQRDVERDSIGTITILSSILIEIDADRW
jgi:hypothetical protein